MLRPGGVRASRGDLTPHKVSLLVLLRECCCGEDREALDTSGDGMGVGSWLPDTVHTASVLLSEHIKGTETHVEISLSELVEQLAASCDEGAAFGSHLAQRMAEFRTLDDVLSFFDLLRQLVTVDEDIFGHATETPTLAPNSLLGLFVRRMLLGLDRMTFSQTARLFRQLTVYARRHHGAPPSPEPIALASGLAELEGHAFDFLSSLSRREAEQYLGKQAGLLATKARPPDARGVQEKVDRMLALCADLPLAHYVSYLNCMRTGEFSGALASLHRYYDFEAAHTEANPEAQSRGRVYFQYATLSLAALHFRFGHWEESILAVHETVRIAQENADHVCLQHALGWLARLGGEAGSQSLAKLFMTRVPEQDDAPYLQALSRYEWARHLLGHGGRPSEVLSSVQAGFKTSIRGSCDDLIAMGYGLRAGLWDLYGNGGLSALNAQLLLSQLEDGSPGDACEAYCKLALQLRSEGRGPDAERVLEVARQQFPLGSDASQKWVAAEAMLHHDKALAIGDLRSAEDAGLQLSAALSASWQSEREARYREALLCLARGQCAEAAQIAHDLQSSDLGNNSCDPSARSLASIKQASLTLLLARAHLGARSCFSALNHGLRCITMAERLHLARVATQAALLVAEVQLELGLAQQASALLSSVTAKILSHGSVAEQGKAHFLRAKCTLALSEPLDCAAAAGSLVRAKACFAQAQLRADERRTLYFLARVYDAMPGREADRNRAAKAFCLLVDD